MIRTFIFIVTFLASYMLHAQVLPNKLPDKILIKDHSALNFLSAYEYDYDVLLADSGYALYKTYGISDHLQEEEAVKGSEFIHNIDNAVINKLIKAINDPNYSELAFKNFGYSADWLAEDSNNLLKYYEAKRSIWTDKQEAYCKNEFSKIENIEFALNRIYLNLGSYSRFDYSESELELQFIYKKEDTITINTSSEKPYMLPWKISEGKKSFNPKISKLVNDILPSYQTYNKIKLEERYFLFRLANQVFVDKCEKILKKLTPLAYEKEINELKENFIVSNVREENAFTGDNIEFGRCIVADLKDPMLNKNIFISLSLNILGKALYTRDSIIKKSKQLLDIVQKVTFINEFLDENPDRRISILFDDGNSLSTEAGALLKWDCKVNVPQQERDKAVFITMKDEFSNSSNWVVLPDLSAVLWFYYGNKAYKFTDKDLGQNTKAEATSKEACVKVDINGNMVK